MKNLIAFVAGCIFAGGLALSSMLNPAKVIAFLDLAGRWDPSLAFVMAGAISVGLFGFALARKRGAIGRPGAQIDARLVGGSLLFGVGWALSGFCPGPAIASLGLALPPLWFTLAMTAGMLIVGAFERAPQRES